MKKFVLALGTVSALIAGVAHAQTAVEDTDGNGVYSFEELVAVFPDLTQEVFSAADADGDGALSADELSAAQAAGNIPA